MNDLPTQWPWLYNGFRRYCVRYARKNFHAVRLSIESAKLPDDGLPILVAANHPSWWDPIVFYVASFRFASYKHFGAMEAAALEKYAFMKRIGLFPVEHHTFRGAANFLRTGLAILEHDHHAVWVTAQGEFADVRKRPLDLQSGVGHLASKMTRGHVVPLAVEYAFWNESKPEALVRFGEAMPVNSGDNGKAWTRRIEESLTTTLDGLNRDAISRDASRFTNLVEGRTGVGGVYDLGRRVKAWVKGECFNASHEASK